MSLDPHALPLIQALASAVSLPSLAPDDDGLLALRIGGATVHLLAETRSQSMLLFASAGALQPNPPAERLAQLLHANRFWRGTGGATLSLDDEQPPRVLLAQRIGWAGTTPAAFVEAFDAFVDHLGDWADWVASGGAAPATAVPGVPERPMGGFA